MKFVNLCVASGSAGGKLPVIVTGRLDYPMQEELRRQYLDSLAERVSSLKALVRDYRLGKQGPDEKAPGDALRLLAHSLYGSGSTFGFPAISDAAHMVEHAPAADLLKYVPGLAKALLDSIEQGKQPQATRVLIIDDDKITASLLRKNILALHPDFVIDLASSATQGQEYLVKHSYALVILDLLMPDRDGRDLLREIRLDFKLTMPVLVLTGINKDMVRVECMSLGADKVLMKPLQEDLLEPVITALLKKGEKTKLELVPKGNEAAPAADPGKTVKVDMSGKLVLLAEDDAIQAALIKQQLGQQGLTVQHASNGREAMAFLRTRHFDLIILDVKMPLFSGFEVLERVRGELGLADVPVIMVTAMGSEADIIRGYDLGANDYLLKPYSPVQLMARVKGFLK
jgi:DNA-binding response OmpR family regulator